MSDPVFPPLFAGQAVEGRTDPFAKACALAALGCDGGTVVYNIAADRLAATIVFAPEVVLEDAMAMLPACGGLPERARCARPSGSRRTSHLGGWHPCERCGLRAAARRRLGLHT